MTVYDEAVAAVERARTAAVVAALVFDAVKEHAVSALLAESPGA